MPITLQCPSPAWPLSWIPDSHPAPCPTYVPEHLRPLKRSIVQNRILDPYPRCVLLLPLSKWQLCFRLLSSETWLIRNAHPLLIRHVLSASRSDQLRLQSAPACTCPSSGLRPHTTHRHLSPMTAVAIHGPPSSTCPNATWVLRGFQLQFRARHFSARNPQVFPTSLVIKLKSSTRPVWLLRGLPPLPAHSLPVHLPGEPGSADPAPHFMWISAKWHLLRGAFLDHPFLFPSQSSSSLVLTLR